MILVTGAAGKTGRAVVGQLVSRRLPVRALVYRAEHEALFRSADGVETNVGALEDAGVTERAMEGAQTVYFICPNVHEFEFVLAATAIELARRSGVERFVYHSVHLPAVEEMPHHWQKHLVEQALSTSGLDYTILQPCTYMQNILGQRTRIEQEREFEVPYSLDARMSLVDLEDVAEAAATVLSTDGHAGATYELCGPEALSHRDVADVLTAELGHTVSGREISPAQWEGKARKVGLPAYAIDSLLEMFAYYDSHGFVGDAGPLEKLLDRPATDLAGFASRTLGGGDSERAAPG